LSVLQQLLREDTAGDPMAQRGLWTAKRLEQISQELSALGLWACPNTVRSLLQKLGYALHANRKSISGSRSPNRDKQFLYIKAQRKEFALKGHPIISVDTKKKELVGNFKNQGRVWSQKAMEVNDHDFRSQAEGMAIPRGLYDTQANRGFVVVGKDHDTAEFAVQAIVHWWRTQGRQRYGRSSDLLILADGGGSNGARCRLWKYALQERLVDPYQLTVTVCHYPPGASKWNPIEHRLFSEISKQWAGQPLKDYPTVVRLIAQTRTKTGLTVKCSLDTNRYASGIKVSNQQMKQLNLHKHALLPEWNYTLVPRNDRN
jgi:Rhodopirellula transposase DDE domain